MASVVGSPLGLQLVDDPVLVPCIYLAGSAGSVEIGDVVMCDLDDKAGGSVVTNLEVGDDNSGLVNVIQPSDSGAVITGVLQYNFFGVVVDFLKGNGANLSRVQVCFRGEIDEGSYGTKASLTDSAISGQFLTASSDSFLLQNMTSGAKIIAIAKEAAITDHFSTGRHGAGVYLDGIRGFGSLGMSSAMGPGTGLDPTLDGVVDRICTYRVQASSRDTRAGDCVQIDPANASGHVTNNDLNNAASGLNNVIQPKFSVGGGPTNLENYMPCGIVIDLLGGAGADDTNVVVRFRGEVDTTDTGGGTKAFVSGSSGVGQPLTISQNAFQLDDTPLAGEKIVAFAKEDPIADHFTTGQDGAGVFFDGINGFGSGG